MKCFFLQACRFVGVYGSSGFYGFCRFRVLDLGFRVLRVLGACRV